jgi:tryptophan synthase beta chain
MGAYQAYLSGALHDFEYPQESIDHALEKLPVVEFTRA